MSQGSSRADHRKAAPAKGDEKQAWVVDYTDQQGIRRHKTFPRKKDADAWASTTTVEVSKGEHVADSATVTVKEAGEAWISSCTADGLERTTTDGYRQHLDLHIAPFLGRTKLSQLSVPVVRNFQDKLREGNRSTEMVRRVTGSLGSLIADALERGQTSHNAVRDMTKRRTRGKKRQAERRRKVALKVGVDIPTPDEIRAIIENVKGRWRPLIITAIFSGLRASELRGLPWADVDFNAKPNPVIRVTQRADRYNKIGSPKSEAARRSIPIGVSVVNTLKEWKLACPASDLDLVFPTGAGHIEYHANMIKRGLMPPQIAAGIVDEEGKAKYTGLHALRHFYASYCINRREDGGLGLLPQRIQERMGHTTLAMTTDTYGHLFESADDSESLAEAERRLLSPVNAT